MGWTILIIIIIIILFFSSLFGGGSSYTPKVETPEEKAEKERRLQYVKRKNEKEYQWVLEKYGNYIDRFCEIAEREVSARDEWGDENWKALPRLKKECIERIGRQYLRDGHTKYDDFTEHDMDRWFYYSDYPKGSKEISEGLSLPQWASKLFSEGLDNRFQEYHEKRKGRYIEDKVDTSNMTGVEFENYLMSLLKNMGFEASGTPTTGDQGADVIASKNGKTFVIQAKRHSKPIGNKAVQEVLAARNFYNGDSGVVVTNNSFTPSAKALAVRNDITLISGREIPQLAGILDKE